MRLANGHMKAADKDGGRHALPQGERPIQMSQIKPKCYQCGDEPYCECNLSAWPHATQLQASSLEYPYVAACAECIPSTPSASAGHHTDALSTSWWRTLC